MAKNRKIEVDGRTITVVANDAQDYISLTDIAKYNTDDSSAVIGNWMRNRNTLEFLGIWESLYNPDFKPLEFEGFKKQAGLNASQLVCLANLENLNALFINEGMAQPERLQKLNRIAIEQMEILTSEHSRRLLGGGGAG